MSNIKDLLAGDPEALHRIWMIWQEAKERERKEKEEHDRKHLENMKRYCFKSKEDMLTYLKAGNRIANYHGYPKEGLEMVDGKIKYTYMVYSEIDMPIGYTDKYYTEEEFMEGDKFFHAYEWDFGYDSNWIKVGKQTAEDCEKVNIKGMK